MKIKNFSYKTRIIRLIATIYTVLAALGLIFFTIFVSQKLHYPLWLQCMLIITAILFLYEAIITLIKPIYFSYTDGIFKVGYLLSRHRFTKSEIYGYSTFGYSTRYGFRNAVLLYLNNRKTLELNEILIDGDITMIVQTFLLDIPHYPLKSHKLGVPIVFGRNVSLSIYP